MLRLLSIKRDEKNNPSLIRLRASVVDKLTNQDKEVTQLMIDAQKEIDSEALPIAPTKRPYSKKGGRTRRRRRATRAKRAIKRSYKMSHKRMQRTRRR